MDCPLYRQPVGFRQRKVGPAPPGVPTARWSVDQAAHWAASQAAAAGGTRQGYTSAAGTGAQYAGDWSAQEDHQADPNERARRQGP
jgi:hypothetical protein